ncbi:MICOS complex subunit MIC13 homolog QIL1 [Drosophila kikkawai]|uniref:MICOS complex subunit MIC13 n=1 Tax=Drosophila kikkawai TaxID=30033 RepID=A0A6P4IUN0_DROKI|nr:MICOS complex subunit MIC13 homolog QIL1 [Drosophila kikkawai]
MAFLLFRIALVAGTVYATQELGIWDSADHTVILFENAKREIQPFAKDLMHRFCSWRCDKDCEDKQTEVKPWRESMVDAWNETVKRSFCVLGVKLPSYYHRFSEDFAQGLDDMVSSPENH